MTRRELIGMTGVGVVAIAGLGGYALTRKRSAPEPAPPPGKFGVTHSDAEWRAMLSPEAYQVLRHAGTETPFTSPLLNEHRVGIFACAGCATHAFDSKTKYDSHTGWPSFWDVLPNAIVKRDDASLGMNRTEVQCATCGGHLGHVFDDGPQPTGLRYCMNGVALAFQPATA